MVGVRVDEELFHPMWRHSGTPTTKLQVPYSDLRERSFHPPLDRFGCKSGKIKIKIKIDAEHKANDRGKTPWYIIISALSLIFGPL